VVGERVYAVLSSGAALALRVRDGKLVWRADMGPQGKRLSPPASDGHRLYVGARDGLYALHLADGGQAWHFPTPRRIEAAPVVLGGIVYAACRDHQLYALDAATGRELWRYAVQRRIELAPALPFRSPVLADGARGAPGTGVTPPPQACVIVADRGGTLTAIARPPDAAELEAAGQWVKAASVHAERGELRRAAELLESHGEPFKAAQLWQALDETERAAEQYEDAGAWQRAVELWSGLGRPLRRAEALEQHARSLADEPFDEAHGEPSDEEQAAAWDVAAEALQAEGEIQRAADCQRQVCCYRRLPIITLDVKSEALVVQEWSLLQLTIRNEGFGPARNLVICAQSDRQFEGQVAGTQRISVLRAGDERTDTLDVRPLQYGAHVPLRLAVEYRDHGVNHSFEHTIHIPVARDKASQAAGQVFHIDTGGGATIVGGVSVQGGGDFIGRDQSTTPGQQPQTPPPAARHSPLASQLYRALCEHLDLDEFQAVCLDLGVTYDHLDGQNLRARSLSLVKHLQNRNALPDLVKWLNQNRPDIKVGSRE
jgi:tetratricopeptide (TPR) repeat protein